AFEKPMIAGRRHYSADYAIVLLLEEPHRRRCFAVIVRERDRPSARNIGVVGRSLLEESKDLSTLGFEGDDLFFASGFDQRDASGQSIASETSAPRVLVAGKNGKELAIFDGYVLGSRALSAVNQL